MTSCCPEEKGSQPDCACQEAPSTGLKPDFPMAGNDTGACCGSQPSDSPIPFEKPGYHLWGFVEDFMQTPAGEIPRVHTQLNREDRRGTVLARLGIGLVPEGRQIFPNRQGNLLHPGGS